ncbi:MAG: sigma-70 family RNA polymerase sigma factor [Mucilaginibacter polytrichastri]|nr:sigma-70 family RNA polymerase sigma factor [Mucilaginibacter polytrichastri]
MEKEHAGSDRIDKLELLYRKTFPAVAAYVARKGGSLNDARDIFQEAVLAWYEKPERSWQNDGAYIMGTAKHMWSRRFNDMSRQEPIGDFDRPEVEEESPSEKRIMNFLEKAGRKCMELLRSFYFEEEELQDIAQRFGFSGVRSATVQKYKCLEKVRETVKHKSLQYEDFLD